MIQTRMGRLGRGPVGTNSFTGSLRLGAELDDFRLADEPPRRAEEVPNDAPLPGVGAVAAALAVGRWNSRVDYRLGGRCRNGNDLGFGNNRSRLRDRDRFRRDQRVRCHGWGRNGRLRSRRRLHQLRHEGQLRLGFHHRRRSKTGHLLERNPLGDPLVPGPVEGRQGAVGDHPLRVRDRIRTILLAILADIDRHGAASVCPK